MEEAATERSFRFRPPKSCIEEVSLLQRSKPKSTQYEDKWAVDVFRNWQAAREKKSHLLDPGSVFKDYDVHRMQSLEKRFEDLDSLSLNFWQRMIAVILEVSKHLFKYCILLEIDFQRHVFRYPNTCVWISNHVSLNLFFTGYQGASMRPK